MFTGLIAAMGTLTGLGRRGDHLVFRVRPEPRLEAVVLGESIALDGYCQTVVAVAGDEFSVEVSPETVARTTAGERRLGDRLNVERALRLGDRLGGHLVAGHVDGVGRVRRVDERGEFVRLAIDAPPEVRRYCVEKGSIAVDGVSLTVNAVDDAGFEVGVIPHTWSATGLRERRPGSRVNLEADLIGKYVERLVNARFAAPSAGVTEALLAEAGFLESKQR